MDRSIWLITIVKIPIIFKGRDTHGHERLVNKLQPSLWSHYFVRNSGSRAGPRALCLCAFVLSGLQFVLVELVHQRRLAP